MGRLVRACDVTREIQEDRQKNQRSNTATASSTANEDMLASSGYWLRMLVVRKGFAPPLRGPSYLSAASGSGIDDKNGRHSNVKGVAGGRSGKTGGRGGKGGKVSKAGRGRVPRGRGKSSPPVRGRGYLLLEVII